MKNFTTLVVALAASASLVVARPALPIGVGLVPGGPALHVVDPKRGPLGADAGVPGNGTLLPPPPPLNNGTLTPPGNGTIITPPGKGNGKDDPEKGGHGRGKGDGAGRGKGRGNGRGNRGGDNNDNAAELKLLQQLLDLLTGGKGAGAGAAGNDPLALLQQLLQGAGKDGVLPPELGGAAGDDKNAGDKANDGKKAGDDKAGDDKAGDDKAGDDKAGDDKADDGKNAGDDAAADDNKDDGKAADDNKPAEDPKAGAQNQDLLALLQKLLDGQDQGADKDAAGQRGGIGRGANAQGQRGGPGAGRGADNNNRGTNPFSK